jgi:hypothetical protein
MANTITNTFVGMLVLFSMIGASVVIMDVSGTADQFGMGSVQNPDYQVGMDEAVEDNRIANIDSATDSWLAQFGVVQYITKALALFSSVTAFFAYLAAMPGIPSWVGNQQIWGTFMGVGAGILILYLFTGRKL